MKSAVSRLLAVLVAMMVTSVSLTGCTRGDGLRASAKVRLIEHRVQQKKDGLDLYLREKRPQNQTHCGRHRAVLFLESLEVPSAEAFDVPGLSWMDDLAHRGFDAFALDVRGFGRSSRPRAMQEPAGENAPVVTTADAVADVDAAVSYIRKRVLVTKVSVVGWGWGGVVAGTYAAAYPGRVDHVVLYGTAAAYKLPSMTGPLEVQPGLLKPMPAYQLAPWETVLGEWVGMAGGPPSTTPATVDSVRTVFLAADPTSGTRRPPSVRRPNGPLVSLYSVWRGRSVYDVTKITAPVFVVRGRSDTLADPGLLAQLRNAKSRRELVVDRATHWLLYEQARTRLWTETAAFLRT